jgi:DNA-binding HxlR family transcriptional regulator/putative sterol carrier protein
MPQAGAARSGRSYNQHCPVARGLDVVGERWTLLIIRDLLVGPKRYKDLLRGSPGIGTNLLATRLRELEQLGIVRRRVLPPPAASAVYELTEAGQALEPIIMAMGRWTMRFLGAPRETDVILPSAYVLGLRARFRPEVAVGLTATYELRVLDQVFEVRIEDGRCMTREGLPSGGADVVITTDMPTLHEVMSGRLPPDRALASGRLTLKGDVRALERFVRAFALDRADEAPPARRRSRVSRAANQPTRRPT